MGFDAALRHAQLRGVAATAQWTAAARARESARADRLFNDPYAGTLAGPWGPALLRHFHTAHAAADGNPVLPIRTRWFDDYLGDAARPGHNVVGLGAGLDTRAFRLGWPAGTVMFEVDQPEVLRYKDERLQACRRTAARCERRAVPADLAGDWSGALMAEGFARESPTAWFLEGVLFYLPEPLARGVLTQMAAISAPGSELAVDLIGSGAFRMPYMRPFLRKLEAAGSPWVFATDNPRQFITECQWAVTAVTEPGCPDASFGRWPGGPVPADFPQLPRSYLVRAARPLTRTPVSGTPERRIPS